MGCYQLRVVHVFKKINTILVAASTTFGGTLFSAEAPLIKDNILIASKISPDRVSVFPHISSQFLEWIIEPIDLSGEQKTISEVAFEKSKLEAFLDHTVKVSRDLVLAIHNNQEIKIENDREGVVSVQALEGPSKSILKSFQDIKFSGAFLSVRKSSDGKIVFLTFDNVIGMERRNQMYVIGYNIFDSAGEADPLFRSLVGLFHHKYKTGAPLSFSDIDSSISIRNAE